MADKKLKASEIFIPLLFGAVGAVALVRGLYHATRALVAKCAGPSSFGACDPTDSVQTAAGEPVYAAVSGKVVLRGDNVLQIASSYEPTIVYYGGLAPSVKEGDPVGIGQSIGASTGELTFGVSQFKAGNVLQNVPPGAWLASRGLTHVSGQTSNLWCDTGRTLTVNPDAKQACSFVLPDKPGFTLLPVSVDMP
jgi:hypothetical protein